MKASDLREQTMEELRDREKDLVDQLFALRLQKVTSQLQNPAKVHVVRRDLARILTVIGEKERATA